MAVTPAGRPRAPQPSGSIQQWMSQQGISAPAAYQDWGQILRDPNLLKLTNGQPTIQSATQYAREVYALPREWQFGADGTLEQSRPWVGRNMWWLAPVALAGGGALASSTGGATGAAAGVLPSYGPSSAVLAAGTGAGTGAGVAAGSLGGTLLKYGLQYGLPAAVNLIGGKMNANAQRESKAVMADYYNKALEAEQEEQRYRRGFDENERDYTRAFNEEGRSYGRYADSYGREDSEERLGYGRATDAYGRASDEERLAYDRSQAIRDKNYGYQQYGNFVETLEPYRAGGSAAASRMSQLMGGPATADTGSYLNLANTARASVQAVPNVPNRPTWSYTANRPTWNYTPNEPRPVGSGQTPSAAGNAPVNTAMPVNGGGSGLIPMRTPGGQVFEVDPAEVATYEQRGAMRA